MGRKKQITEESAPPNDSFVPTELGSARFTALEGVENNYKRKTDQVFPGPPWSVEPSMNSICEEVGIDYHRFIDSLAANKKDLEIAQELGISEITIKNLRDHFFRVESINGNYGQD